MTPRGPDEQGLFNREGVALGARRLSIIDLAGGQQPITNEDSTVWIVFNGEIYNYRELRADLLERGHRFRTDCDTEVIVHLYEEYGTDCVKHLNGMFTFAIWDSVRRSVMIARDFVGIKPLYYTVQRDRLIFGSEMKVVLTHPDVVRRVDMTALDQYLTFEYVPTPLTIIEDVFRLPPGHLLIYDADGLKQEQYWDFDLSPAETPTPQSIEAYQAGLLTALESSVRRELVSDVPVGVFLSGGIDSSTIAALMTRLYPDKVRSFSIAFDDPSFDESRYARMVAAHIGTEHHEQVLTARDVTAMIPSIADFLDEPFADSSLIPTFLVSRFAQEQVKVVLSGDGGDELFAGYPTVLAHRLFERYQRWTPAFARRRVLPAIVNRLPVSFNNLSFDFKLKRFIAGEGLTPEIRHHRWLGSFTEAEKYALLRHDALAPDARDTFAPVRGHAARCADLTMLNRILYLDMKMYMEGDILFKVDRASMATSLEVRVPLLNRDMLDFARRLPFDMKLRGSDGKHLLKRAMADFLPEEILKRKKKGFNMPVAHWLTHELKDLMNDLLSPSRLRAQGYFEAAAVGQIITEHMTRQRDHRKGLWTLLMFQLWHQRYME